VIWRDTHAPSDELGPPDVDGFWVQDFLQEGTPWVRIWGTSEDGYFIVDGTGRDARALDVDLVREVARSVRDDAPIPVEAGEWVDASVIDQTPLSAAAAWHAEGRWEGRLISIRVAEGPPNLELQVAESPWQCGIVSVRSGRGVLCGHGDWSLTWNPAPGVTATLATVGVSSDDLIAMAESMVLVAPDDPRVADTLDTP
jgi:hypothetical protein